MKDSPNIIKVGIPEYTALLDRREIYVDKTKDIQKLLTHESGLIILTRPRRFGKTLLVSTIEQILLGNRDRFVNTFIGG
jgi:predicted AAA+ superfamily ATPase